MVLHGVGACKDGEADVEPKQVNVKRRPDKRAMLLDVIEIIMKTVLDWQSLPSS
jgi:hypothetical protein